MEKGTETHSDTEREADRDIEMYIDTVVTDTVMHGQNGSKLMITFCEECILYFLLKALHIL